MRYAIYARYSSDMQSERSIEDQIRVCREFAERSASPDAARLIETYTDYAISGAHTAGRPALLKLLADAAARRFDTVVAEGLDRISRDQEDIAGLYKRLTFAGIGILTVSEGRVDELHIGLKGTMNALFLKDLAIKVRRGQRGRVEAGFSAGGRAFGYDVVRELDAKGELVRGKRRINESQAEIVRRIFEEYVAGRSARTIAAGLNADGIPGPTGGEWSASTINGNRARRNGFLYQEAYAGYLVYNRIRMVRDPGTGKRVSRPNPPEDWIVKEAPHLRIVSEDLWDRAQARKARYADRRPETARRAKRLLSGLVGCGVCGGGASIVIPGRYGCVARRQRGTCDNNRSISAGELEQRVLAGIKHRLMHPDAVEEFIAGVVENEKKARKAAAAGRRSRQRELAEAEAQIQQIVNAIANGTDVPAMHKTIMEIDARATELREAEAALDAADASGAVIGFHPRLAEVYRDQVAELAEALNDDETRDEAAALIRSLIHKIEIYPGEDRGQVDVKMHAYPAAALAFAKDGPPEIDTVITLVAGGGLEPPTSGL